MEITLKSVSKVIKNITILDNISCQFSSDNIYGVVGRNGSGKTMLLRIISGLIIPTSGTVDFDGKQLHKDISFPPSIGLIIEKPEFLGYMTGYDNLKQLAAIKEVVSEDTIKEYMRMFSLNPLSNLPMRKYSLGMKQKIGIIQAIMENPDILILDEPFNGLDEQSVLLLRQLLLEYKNAGKLIIITSHHKEDIESICNSVLSVSEGKLVLV